MTEKVEEHSKHGVMTSVTTMTPTPPPPVATDVGTKLPPDGDGVARGEADFARCPKLCSVRGSTVITFVVALVLIAIVVIVAVLLGT